MSHCLALFSLNWLVLVVLSVESLPFNTFSLRVVPLLCIAGAWAIIYLPFGVVAVARLQLGYNYNAPRAMFDSLPPFAQRATWAHQNGFETFAPFAAAALMAYVTGPHEIVLWQGLTGDTWITLFASSFLGFRVLYGLFYIADIPYARSFSYVMGAFSTLGLLGISLVPLVVG